MLSSIWNACKNLFNRAKESLKKWTKPATVTLALGAIQDLTRSKSDLVVENAILRQQLIVLKRSVKRPKLTAGDRVRLTLLARLTNFWRSALHIVQPDTILRWHRDMFRRYWKKKSTPRVESLPLYVFVIVEHESRKVVHTAVTKNPTDEWTAQQVREATPWGKRPKYLFHDNDGKFGSQFKNILKNSGIKAIKTPPKAPRANAICERFIGSLQRECTDNFLIFHTYQLHRIISIYADYFNKLRPHQGIDQHIPIRFDESTPPSNYLLKGKVVATPVLNGLFHSYSYAHQLQ